MALIGAFYIPRLLGTEKYGIYQTILNYVNIFLFFTLEGFNKVTLREASKDIHSTKEIIESILGIKYLSSFIGILVAISALFLVDYEHTTKIYIALFSITLVLKSLHSSIFIIYRAYERMKIIAILDTLQTTLVVCVSILLLKFGYGVFEIVLGNVIIVFFITGFNYFYSKRYFKLKLIPTILIAKHYIKPGINFSLIHFLDILSTRVDIVMLSILTNPTEVGIYALADKIFGRLKLLRSSISQSIFPHYAKQLVNNNLTKQKMLKHTGYMFIFSIILILIVNLGSKPLIANIVGVEFIRSSTIINILVFNFALGFISIPWNIFLQVTNREKNLIKLGVLRSVSNITLNIIFFNTFGLVGIAYSTLLTTLLYVITLFLMIKYRNISNNI